MPSSPPCLINNAYMKRYPWRVCYAALAILATVLLLNGCENKGAAEQAGAQVDEAARGMKDTLDTTNPVAPPQARPVEEAGKYPDEQMDDALPKQQNPAQ